MSHLARIPLTALTIALTMAGAACLQPPADAGDQPAPAPQTASPASSDVFSNPSLFAGQTVEVHGVSQGYRVDDCRFAAAARPVSLTRGDWVLLGDSHCLYVTGGTPAGLDPADLGSIGRRLVLRGRVIDGGDGRFLLQLVEARLLDGS